MSKQSLTKIGWTKLKVGTWILEESTGTLVRVTSNKKKKGSQWIGIEFIDPKGEVFSFCPQNWISREKCVVLKLTEAQKKCLYQILRA